VGQLRAKTNRQGLTVNGVLLGDAPITLIDGTAPGPGDLITDCWFLWDDPHRRRPRGRHGRRG